MTHDSKAPSDTLDQLRADIAEIERLRAAQPTPQQSADAVKQRFYRYCLNAGVG